MMKTATPTCFGTSPQRVGFSAALALFTLSILPTGAETMTFTATGDNTILSGNLANDNYGAYNPISSGTVGTSNQRSILRFDVSTFSTLRNRLTASSTEDANAALHPQLIVNYTAIPEPSSMLLLGLGGLVMFRRRRD